ncbi:MAG: hypothetical protein KC516_02460 [Nanoarchaeota archaeon]|nr:hypothetical protein [Nanoarchaeota archaeon]
MKLLIVFIFAVALPLATAFNCTSLNGENYEMCNYIENTNWPQDQKDIVIEEIIGSSMNGDFESELDQELVDPIELNELEENSLKIEEENKKFLLDISSLSIFGYFSFLFLRRYFLLKLI